VGEGRVRLAARTERMERAPLLPPPASGARIEKGASGGRLILVLFLLLLALPAHAAEPRFPALAGRVIDEAGILPPAAVDRLTGMLAAHEQATGEQVVVVTLASLQGYEIEEFGYRLGRAWGIGQKDKNTGALLIVAPKERAVRIEVGYGLEGRLTDAQSRAIIERDILPAFRRGDLPAGVLAGTASILATLGGAAAPDAAPRRPAEPTASDVLTALIVLLVVFIIVVQLFGRRRGYIVGPMGGGLWTAGGGRSRDDAFGGFSGGGGSFGGGGATGRW
jgi:uncharacterized protein